MDEEIKDEDVSGESKQAARIVEWFGNHAGSNQQYEDKIKSEQKRLGNYEKDFKQ